VKIYANQSVSKYALIICLSVALLLGQMFKVHMHIQHDETPSPATAGHSIDVHAALSLLNAMNNIHHHGDTHDHHHHAVIDINTDTSLKAVDLFKLSIFLFLLAGIALSVPLLRGTRRRHIFNAKLLSLYYLLHTPLRAPPK